MTQEPPKDYVSKIFDLSEILAYQEGSVVSKTLIDKKVGTITLFSFDKDQGLSEHTAPFDAFVYIIEGEADIVLSKKSHFLTAGKMIIMPANKPHALKALTKFKMMLIMIKE
jgi:quercetin dioxygenase-like cupin family protein